MIEFKDNEKKVEAFECLVEAREQLLNFCLTAKTCSKMECSECQVELSMCALEGKIKLMEPEIEQIREH